MEGRFIPLRLDDAPQPKSGDSYLCERKRDREARFHLDSLYRSVRHFVSNQLGKTLMTTKAISTAVLLLAASSVLAKAQSASTNVELRVRLNDSHVVGADYWIYNNLDATLAQAKRLNRPVFVTFRCVPCKACAGFDAEVANGSERIRSLAESSFVPLRQVEMKGVDLSQFQFDHDLNWAAMFINADGTVYGRYGTQSALGPDAYNSTESLEKAMQRVLKLHAEYPKNAAALAAKRAAPKPYKTALEMPGLENREKLSGLTAKNNCIHCHNIHDAENVQMQSSGQFKWEMLYRYPLPDNVGIHIDPQDGCKIERVDAGSPAAKAGLQAGDIVTHANGQPIISIADIQWVLHHLPNTAARVEISASRDGKANTHTLQLAPDWKKSDIFWRGSMWSVKPRPGFWAPLANEEEIKALHLPPESKPLRISVINTNHSEGRAARQAGLREGDIVTHLGGKLLAFTPKDFHMHVRMNYRVGDKLPLTIVRDGQTQRIELPLVD
jgi:serine protease Do